MDIKKLTLKNILGKDWIFEPDFCYADVSGNAELYKEGDSLILFRKEGEKDVCAVRFRAILNYDKKLFHTANKLMADIGLDFKMGDRLNKIIKKMGTPDFIYYLEEDYERYYWRYPHNFYDYNDIFYVVHYHYLVSPDLLVCLGVPKIDNRLTDLEIINDPKMITDIMQTREKIKEYEKELYQPKECKRFLKQRMENGAITEIKSQNIRFIKMEIENYIVEGIETADLRMRSCLFRNVTFENHFETGFVQIEQCVFINCMFHDTFGDSFVELTDSVFQNCVFENIGMEKGIFNANINNFLDCVFRGIQWNGGGVFFRSKIKGGKMQHIFYTTNDISSSDFSDIQIEHMEVEMEDEDSIGFFENQFNTVRFCDTTVRAPIEDTYFVNCDTSGLNCMVV